eukprot:4790346-Prorocentrum_lima.AAC.1
MLLQQKLQRLVRQLHQLVALHLWNQWLRGCNPLYRAFLTVLLFGKQLGQMSKIPAQIKANTKPMDNKHHIMNNKCTISNESMVITSFIKWELHVHVCVSSVPLQPQATCTRQSTMH